MDLYLCIACFVLFAQNEFVPLYSVLFCLPEMCFLYCSVQLVFYLYITCIILSIRIVLFVLFILIDIHVFYHYIAINIYLLPLTLWDFPFDFCVYDDIVHVYSFSNNPLIGNAISSSYSQDFISYSHIVTCYKRFYTVYVWCD